MYLDMFIPCVYFVTFFVACISDVALSVDGGSRKLNRIVITHNTNLMDSEQSYDCLICFVRLEK